VNVLAAIGVAQMEQFPGFLNKKKQIDAFYRSELGKVGDITFQKVQDHTSPNCWLFTFKTEHKNQLLNFLNNNGVQCRPFWVPMNQLPMFKNTPYVNNNDVSNSIYNTSVSIPCSTGIKQQQLETVVKKIKDFYEGV
jgi:dTDP-4-amino-4,6-dideoxygalactose transaminase